MHDRFLRACRREPTDVTPVWFMRQAGRSLPEYRELRVGTAMLDACLDPAMASEITLQPVRRHGVDAGIFFSDIVVPIKLAGVDVEIVPGRGPVLGSPIRSAADVDALATLDPAALAPISEAVARTVEQLGDTPLIGFAGAPFTLAAYLVEGGPSKDHIRARTLMHADPETWSRLLAWAAEHGVELWITAADGASVDPTAARARRAPIGLVLGNEGAGVGERLAAAAVRRVAIPLAPGVESLNVAVAAGILLYGVTRDA